MFTENDGREKGGKGREGIEQHDSGRQRQELNCSHQRKKSKGAGDTSDHKKPHVVSLKRVPEPSQEDDDQYDTTAKTEKCDIPDPECGPDDFDDDIR